MGFSKGAKYRRHSRRVKGLIVFLCTVLGVVFAYTTDRHQSCAETRSIALAACGRTDWQFGYDKLLAYTKECRQDDQQVLDSLIEAAFQEGNLTESRHWIETTARFFPADPVPRYWTGVLLLLDPSHQDSARAVSIFSEVRDQVRTSFPQVDLFWGMAQIQSGDVRGGCE